MTRAAWALAAAALGLVLLGVLAASAFPDGIERVAADLGFARKETPVLPAGPLAGYQTRFFQSAWASQAVAGVVGLVLLYAFGIFFGRTLKRKK